MSERPAGAGADPPPDPLFQVVRGTPTAEELAALVGVLIFRRRPPTPPATQGVSAWARSARPGGPRGWRTSTNLTLR